MSNLNKVLLVLVILLLLLLALVIGSLVLLNQTNRSNTETPRDTNRESGSNNISTEKEEIKNEYTPLSLRREKVDFRPAKRITINELNLANTTLTALKKKNWNQDRKSPLPLSGSDFDSSQLRILAEDDLSKKKRLEIADEYKDLLITAQAQKEIFEEMIASRREFLKYLETKGVDKKYIEEFNYVLPEDSKVLIYYPSLDSSEGPTAVSWFLLPDKTKDQSRQILEVFASDIQNTMQNILLNSGVLGGVPREGSKEFSDYLRDLRSMSIRNLLYHEFTHTLQQAYVNIHHAYPNRPDIKGSWAHASKTPMDFDKTFYWRWGPSEVNAETWNHNVAVESQAEGVSFGLTVDILNLSKQQADILWEHYFGRYEEAQKVLASIKRYFDQDFTNFPPNEFSSKMFDFFLGYSIEPELLKAILNMAQRFDNLSSYIGYLNPIEPSNLDKSFWSYFK